MIKQNDTTAIVPMVNVEAPPAEIERLMKVDAGRGVSFKSEDTQLPLVHVLQSGTPVCDKRSPNYIDGAEPGHFWFRNDLNPIRNGVTGIIVVFCETRRVWVVWKGGRQGFVEQLDQPPSDMEEGRDENGKACFLLPNGNVVEDTRQCFILHEGAPYVLPLTKSKHRFFRDINTRWRQLKDPKTGAVYPIFARRYKLTTKSVSNALGKWFGLQFADAGWASKAEYEAARALADFVEAGRYRANYAGTDPDAGNASGSVSSSAA
jgi:hypothetical protein